MRRMRHIVVFAAISMGIIITVKSRPQTYGQATFLLTEKDAVGLVPPDVVSGATTISGKWSPTGEFVLLQRNAIQFTQGLFDRMYVDGAGMKPELLPEVNLILWNRRARRADIVWKVPSGMGSVSEYRWLPQSDIALAVISTKAPGLIQGQPPVMRQNVLRIDGSYATSRSIIETDEDDSIEINTAPDHAAAVIRVNSFNPVYKMLTSYIYVVGQSGLPGPRITVPPTLRHWWISWQVNGNATLISHDSVKNPKPHVVEKYFTINIKTRSVTPLDKAPQLVHETDAPDIANGENGSDVNAKPELRVCTGAGSLTSGGSTAKVKPLWLYTTAKSEQPQALICADGDWAILSPKQDAVLYCEKGVAAVASIVHISKEQFQAMLDAARRAVLTSNGKQIALAVLMYSQDYDENFPDGSTFAQGAISPYIKNESVMEGFVYTLQGGAMKDIEKPAETEMGYIPGPGGKVVVYADGHVKWKPNE